MHFLEVNTFGRLNARIAVDSQNDKVNHNVIFDCASHNFLNDQNEEINDLFLTHHLEINQGRQLNSFMIVPQTERN